MFSICPSLLLFQAFSGSRAGCMYYITGRLEGPLHGSLIIPLHMLHCMLTFPVSPTVSASRIEFTSYSSFSPGAQHRLFFKDFNIVPDAQVTTKPIYNKVSFSQNGGKGSTFISYVQIYFSAFSYYLYKVKFFVFLLFCLHICIIFCTFAA